MSNVDENENMCQAHPAFVDMDCDYCQAEIAHLTDVITKLEAKASRAEQEILYQGAALNPMMFHQLRLEMLIEVAFTDPRQRARFQINYAQNVLKMLAEAKRQVTQEKLKVTGNQVQAVNFRKPRH